MKTKLLMLMCFFTWLSFIQSSAAQEIAANESSQFVNIYKEAGTLAVKSLTLKNVLVQIENRFDVSIAYPSDLVKDKNLRLDVSAFASPEDALHKALTPFNLTFEKIRNQFYLVSAKGVRIEFSSSIQQANFQHEVRGKITDEEGNALVGATVKLKGSTSGTETGVGGTFSLNVPEDDNQSLEISFIGYETIEFQIGNRTQVNITLKKVLSTLNEVVVTGYSTQKKKDITGAVTVINVEEMNKQPTGQLANKLQGQASGVTILGSGQPGEEPQIRIRGINTFGNNTPLFIIDGIPTQNISDINPNDVASIQVLKDAGAASIYGSRASNGVIIVTTKQGRGKVKFSYDGYYGTQRPKTGNVWDILSPQDMAKLKFDASANSGKPINASNADALYGPGPNPVLPDYIYPTGAHEGDPSVDPSLYHVDPEYKNADELATFYRIVRANKAGTDWYHEVNKPALIQNHNVAVSGGGDQGKYFLSLNYFNQEGSVIYTYLKRYTIRANTQFNISKRIRIGENLSYSVTDNNKIIEGEGSFIGYAFRAQPILPVYDIMGNFAGTYGGQVGNEHNPVALAYRTRNNSGLNNRLFSNVYADVDITNSLTFHTSFGGESYANTRHSFQYPEYEAQENVTKNSYSESSAYGYNWTWTNTLNYHKTFGNHNVSLMAGTEAYDNNYREMGATTSDYFSFDPNFTTLNTGSGTATSYSDRSTDGLWSQFGRLDYNYKDRYLLSSTLRRDGSSKFVNDKYGVFPAITVAWRLSEENFMKGLSWINDLKIRGGWGVMGNQFNVNPSNGFSTYAIDRDGSYYDIAGSNNSIQQGFQTGQIANPDAIWEKDNNTNIGLDATLFKGKISLTIDYYKKDIQDLLFNPALPATQGAGTVPFENVAGMTNSGIDLQIGTHTNITRDLNFDGSLIFTTYNNKITKVSGGADYFLTADVRRFGQSINRSQVGHSVGAFYGYQIVGFWNDQSEIDKANADAQKVTNDPATVYQTDLGLGRFRYKDVNGDGIITDADRTFIGNPHPKFTYGANLALSYKNFDFSMFLYGSYGNDIWNNVKWWLDFYPSFAGPKSHTALYDSWTPTNHNAKAPIQEIDGNISTNGVPNSYFVESGSYLRAKNVTLGYTLPTNLVKKAFISSLRFYVQAANLFTITKYSGVDPEVTGTTDGVEAVTDFGVDEGAYPSTRNFLIGVNLKF
jgi:TonB-linked SusC/RagA family outer membrane protein